MVDLMVKLNKATDHAMQFAYEQQETITGRFETTNEGNMRHRGQHVRLTAMSAERWEG